MLNILQHARGNITHIKKVNYTPMWFHIRVNNSSLSFCLWSVCMRDTHLPVQIDSAVSFLFLWSWIPQRHLSSKWYHFKKFLLSGLRTCDVTGHSDTSFLRKITRAIKQTGNELYVVDSLDFCLKGVLYISVLIWVKDVCICALFMGAYVVERSIFSTLGATALSLDPWCKIPLLFNPPTIIDFLPASYTKNWPDLANLQI